MTRSEQRSSPKYSSVATEPWNLRYRTSGTQETPVTLPRRSQWVSAVVEHRSLIYHSPTASCPRWRVVSPRTPSPLSTASRRSLSIGARRWLRDAAASSATAISAILCTMYTVLEVRYPRQGTGIWYRRSVSWRYAAGRSSGRDVILSSRATTVFDLEHVNVAATSSITMAAHISRFLHTCATVVLDFHKIRVVIAAMECAGVGKR